MELIVLCALSTATVPILPKCLDNGIRTALYQKEYSMHSFQSGAPMAFFPQLSDFYQTQKSIETSIDILSMKMQQRYKILQRLFNENNEGFPTEKFRYFNQMANALCQLDFDDNVSSYNEFDESIDTILKLKNGLTLSVSCFVDEEINAPMVFSIHRDTMLLVSDELPVDEMVKTIKSVSA